LGGLAPPHPLGAIPPTNDSISSADADVMGGRVKPGHDEIRM
jgi:hypothetical protein